jgi:hypothetical protein
MGKQSLFVVRTVRNTQMHCVGSPYLTGNTSRFRYRVQPVNAVWGNSRCLLLEPHGTYQCIVWSECRVLEYYMKRYIQLPLRSSVWPYISPSDGAQYPAATADTNKMSLYTLSCDVIGVKRQATKTDVTFFIGSSLKCTSEPHHPL